MNTIMVHKADRFEAGLYTGSEVLPNDYVSVDIGTDNLDIHVFIDDVEILDKLIEVCQEAKYFLEKGSDE